MIYLPLMVDDEDGFGNAVNVVGTVREMEAAGVAAVGIEDNFVPRSLNVADPGLIAANCHILMQELSESELPQIDEGWYFFAGRLMERPMVRDYIYNRQTFPL